MSDEEKKLDETLEDKTEVQDKNTDALKEEEKTEEKKEEKKEVVNKKLNKKNAIMLGTIAILTIIVILLSVKIIGKDKKSDDNASIDIDVASSTDVTGNDNSDADGSQTTTSQENQDATGDNSSTGNSSSNQTAASGAVVVTLGNQWESEGAYFGQADISISNSSSAELKNWKVEIPVSEGVSIEQNWSCECQISNGKLIITPVDYNNSIEPNGKLDGVGVILKAPNQAALSSVTASAELYVNGELFADNTSDNNTDDTTATTENNSGETTTENSTTENSTTENPNTTTETNNNPPVHTETGTPYANHGELSVSGTNIVDMNGVKYQLKGASTHGIAWFPGYVNKAAFQTLRDDWGANLIRIAMYSGENSGYCTGGDKTTLKNLVCTGVDAATELGMYVIIDWHVLGDLNPLVYKEEAKAFFEEMSAKYKNNGNVIYEICNEPNGGTSWADVKTYAEEVIPIIKANNPDAIIIVGTPNWSQDVDAAAANPITGYTNIMYATHFYAATHTDWLRNKVTSAIASGLPIFISEFSICDASGNGANNYTQADAWFDLINQYNLSYAAWSLCNKNETSALISSSCTKTSGWVESDLSETGKWIRNKILGN